MMRVKYYPPGELGTKVSKQKYINFLKLIATTELCVATEIVNIEILALAQSLWRFNRLKDIYDFTNAIKRDLPMLEYEIESLERQYPEYSF